MHTLLRNEMNIKKYTALQSIKNAFHSYVTAFVYYTTFLLYTVFFANNWHHLMFII